MSNAIGRLSSKGYWKGNELNVIRLIKEIVHEYLNVADFGVLQSYSEKTTAITLI